MPNVEHFMNILDAVSRRDLKEVVAVGRLIVEEEKKKKHFGVTRLISDAIDVIESDCNTVWVVEHD